ncbi:MAG: rod shape-determining protein RodA [Flavobacteriales bacterium]
MINNWLKNIDLQLLLIYFVLVILGIASIYSTTFDESYSSIFSFNKSYGKQIMWFGISLCVGIIILLLDIEFIRKYTEVFYGITTLLLILVLLFGTERNGAKAWFGIGSFGIQPAEFAKITASLFIAKYLASVNTSIYKLQSQIWVSVILFVPIILILKQPDLGTVLVFLGFILVLYREGIIGSIMLYGLMVAAVSVVSLILKDTFSTLLGYTFHSHYMLIGALVIMAVFIALGVNITTYKRYRRTKHLQIIAVTAIAIIIVPLMKFGFEKIPENHYQRVRVEIILGLKKDPRGVGYNSHQALSAIGSGQFLGKGYKNATLANDTYNQVPEQSTDFIFCTVAEEWGFLGSFLLFSLYMILIIKIIAIAERQRSDFGRIFSYSVASIFFIHFTINIGMVLGLAPIIGIPLPFFSYGGSSLLTFSIMIFLLLKIDSDRLEIFR